MKNRIILILLLVIIAGAVVFVVTRPRRQSDVTTGRSKINRVETMVQLCAIDLYSEVPVLDTINNKVLFGIQKQTGSISFDLDKLEVDESGDTVRMVLPPEIIDVKESTEPGAWQVIDTKAIGNMAIFHSGKLTVEEENQIKAGIGREAVGRLYRNGTVERARAEARINLKSLMERLYRRPVTVDDPTPKGTIPSDLR